MKRINRCPLRPTEEQLDEASESTWRWVQAHQALYAYVVSYSDHYREILEIGNLNILQLTFVSAAVRDTVLPEHQKKVFRVTELVQLPHEGNANIILDDGAGSFDEKGRRYGRRKEGLSLYRKYYRWVRRNVLVGNKNETH